MILSGSILVFSYSYLYTAGKQPLLQSRRRFTFLFSLTLAETSSAFHTRLQSTQPAQVPSTGVEDSVIHTFSLFFSNFSFSFCSYGQCFLALHPNEIQISPSLSKFLFLRELKHYVSDVVVNFTLFHLVLYLQ